MVRRSHINTNAMLSADEFLAGIDYAGRLSNYYFYLEAMVLQVFDQRGTD